MYEEISKDLGDQQTFPRKEGRPLWGLAIKSLLEARKKLGEDHSIQWLSKEAGINSKHLINIIAQRVKDPSGDKLLKIADAFQISFGELAQRATFEHPSTFYITGTDRPSIDYGLHGFSIEALSRPGTRSRDFFVGIMKLKPLKVLKKWKFPERLIVGMFVESGTLEFSCEEKTERVPANGFLSFDAQYPHRISNIDSKEARVIIVTYPALY